jgi:hypothetical protein
MAILETPMKAKEKQTGSRPTAAEGQKSTEHEARL